jgi:hypothetical protein
MKSYFYNKKREPQNFDSSSGGDE